MLHEERREAIWRARRPLYIEGSGGRKQRYEASSESSRKAILVLNNELKLTRRPATFSLNGGLSIEAEGKE